MTAKIGDLLGTVNDPSDLRKLKVEELPRLCDEIRQFIIDVISANPGHLGASLGTVKLTVAIFVLAVLLPFPHHEEDDQ